jgi:hypothetical protein
MPKHGIRFIAKAAKRVQAESHSLLLEDDEVLAYNYLVIASGPRLAFEKYCLRKIKQGRVEPFFERYAMRLMGVQKLKGSS